MKRIIKEIDEEIKRLRYTEQQERLNCNHQEANKLCLMIADLTDAMNIVKREANKLCWMIADLTDAMNIVNRLE